MARCIVIGEVVIVDDEATQGDKNKNENKKVQQERGNERGMKQRRNECARESNTKVLMP
jgi:hypothetical protein